MEKVFTTKKCRMTSLFVYLVSVERLEDIASLLMSRRDLQLSRSAFLFLSKLK